MYALFEDGRRVSKAHSTVRAVFVEAFELGAMISTGTPDFITRGGDPPRSVMARLVDEYDIREVETEEAMDVKNFGLKVEDERNYQARRWGDGTSESLDRVDDEKNEATDFVAFIAYHSTRWFPGGFPPYDRRVLQTFRSQMVKVAALAYAAHEWAGRRLAGMPDAKDLE